MTVPVLAGRFRLALVGLAIASLLVASAPAGLASMPVQQPAPPQPGEDILEEINSPEAQADRDLERMGRTKTREQASRRLKAAVDRVAAPGGIRMPLIDVDSVVKCDDPRVQDLEDAVRYYVRAHGLPTGAEELKDLSETSQAVGDSEVGLGGEAARAARAERFGTGEWDLWYALDALRRIKARPCPGPTTIGSTGQRGGRGKAVYIAGGAAAVTLGALALSGGGDDAAPDNTPPRVDLTSAYGSYAGNLAITGSTGCGRPGSSMPVQVTLSGNPDGSNFVYNKGGLIFAGTLRADRSFEVEYVGTINGFPGLPNGSGIRWRLTGALQGSQLTAAGVMNVNSGPCAQNDIMTSVMATRN